MFEDFEQNRSVVRAGEINYRIGGNGPPLLLLHGFPQTHVLWHKIAPALSQHFTVICPDLRGYGDSSKPAGGADHGAYAKRAMAGDQVELMDQLGFTRFFLAGHDRGARVAHRLALDHAERVRKVALLDIVPTLTAFERADMAFGMAYYHWFFLAQPFDFPERMIGAAPETFLHQCLNTWSKTPGAITPEALSEYERCYRDPASIHATCEDYRAGASIDLAHDRADQGKRIECPLLALWGEKSIVGKQYDVLAVWREKAEKVSGQGLDCGHFVPEEAPEQTLAAFLDFFS